MSKREIKRLNWISEEELKPILTKLCLNTFPIKVHSNFINDKYSDITIYYSKYFIGRLLKSNKTGLVIPIRGFKWTLDSFVEHNSKHYGTLLSEESKNKIDLKEDYYINRLSLNSKEVISMDLKDCMNFDSLPSWARSNMLRQYSKGLEKFKDTLSESICAIHLYCSYKEISRLFHISTNVRKGLLATYENRILRNYRTAKKLCNENLSSDLLSLYLDTNVYNSFLSYV